MSNIAPLDKLLLYIANNSGIVVLDPDLAKLITGSPSVGGLVDLVNIAVQQGWASRVNENGPALDPDAHRDQAVLLTLTQVSGGNRVIVLKRAML